MPATQTAEPTMIVMPNGAISANGANGAPADTLGLDHIPVLRSDSTLTDALVGFDEYMLGYRDRSAALDPQHAAKITPGSNGVFQPTVVIDGQVVGVWKRTLKKASVRLDVAPFAAVGEDAVDGIVAAAARYSHFIGQPVNLQE